MGGAPLFCKGDYHAYNEDIFVGFTMYDSPSENKMFSTIENRREWITSVIEDESKTDWNILIAEDTEYERAEISAGRASLKIWNNYLPFLLPNDLVIPIYFLLSNCFT